MTRKWIEGEHEGGKVDGGCECARNTDSYLQKNPRAHKNKIGTPHPPKPKIPPLKRGILWTQVSCRKNAFFQAPIKLAQAFPAPELRTRILRTRGFSDIYRCMFFVTYLQMPMQRLQRERDVGTGCRNRVEFLSIRTLTE